MAAPWPRITKSPMSQRLRRPIILITLTALVLGAVYWFQHGRDKTPSSPLVTAELSTPAEPRVSHGQIDWPNGSPIQPSPLRINGWVLDAGKIEKVEAVLDGVMRFPLRYGVDRPDVAAAFPDIPGNEHAGFEGMLSLPPLAPGLHELKVVAIDAQGRRKFVGTRHLLGADSLDYWRAVGGSPGQGAFERFFVLFSTSGVGQGGANEIAETYAPFTSDTLRVGMRVPILYLRTTHGRARDWEFDPDWNVARACDGKLIAEDSLNQVIDYAVKHRLPVMFTLNGGVWADARCDVPDWDVNDALEQDLRLCQWNEADEVPADDHLKHLPGSESSPELGRSLTLNVYAGKVRHYKKRNLQQAARVIRAFAQAHPDLFAGVNLDPDVYVNPFYEEPKRWFDFNPDTLRQFRDWLRGDGPYAGRGGPGVPDLSAYRRARPLTLAEVGKLSGRTVTHWDQVQPPRAFPRVPPFWNDPWVREWELFRRHLVDLHYDELSHWLVEAGLDRRMIFSSQGFIAPRGRAKPFAVRLDSPVKNYDSGGMTVAGSVPAEGNLGAILYGEAAVNHIRMEGSDSLFATFRRLSPDWGVVEHNTADFREPKELPGLTPGYRSLRDLFNYGGRMISPMAWNGSNGLYAGHPEFASFTAIRNTPLELAIKNFLVTHANFPRGGRLWTFGTPILADDDGWRTSGGTLTAEADQLRLTAAEAGKPITLLSPPELDLQPGRHGELVIRLADPAALARLEIQGASHAVFSDWKPLADVQTPARLDSPVGLRIPLAWGRLDEAQRIRLRLWPRNANAPLLVDHVAVLPRQAPPETP